MFRKFCSLRTSFLWLYNLFFVDKNKKLVFSNEKKLYLSYKTICFSFNLLEFSLFWYFIRPSGSSHLMRSNTLTVDDVNIICLNNLVIFDTLFVFWKGEGPCVYCRLNKPSILCLLLTYSLMVNPTRSTPLYEFTDNRLILTSFHSECCGIIFNSVFVVCCVSSYNVVFRDSLLPSLNKPDSTHCLCRSSRNRTAGPHQIIQLDNYRCIQRHYKYERQNRNSHWSKFRYCSIFKSSHKHEL